MRTKPSVSLLAMLIVMSIGHFSTVSAVVLSAGDVIKLDFSTAGDGDGGSLFDWNQTNNGSAPIAAGAVKRHGDGAILDGVSISFSGAGVGGGFNNDAGSNGWGGQAADPYLIGGANDIFFGPNPMITSFEGLDPNLDYNVRAYVLIGNNAGTVDRVTVEGAITQSRDSTRGVRFNAATLQQGGTVFANAKVDGSNGIDVTVQGVSNAFYPLQAIVLEAVPSFDGSQLFSVDIAGGPRGNGFGDASPQAKSGFEPNYGFGDVWNEYFVKAFDNASPAPAPLQGLVDSNGNSSSVQFQILGDVQGWPGDGNQGNDALTRDYLFLDAGQSADQTGWEISGLISGGLYELYAYGGATRSVNLFVDQSGEGATFGAAGHLFGNIFADGQGRITGMVGDGPAGGEQNWAGFQLRLLEAPVPEPTTALLLTLGSIGLVSRRRRQA